MKNDGKDSRVYEPDEVRTNSNLFTARQWRQTIFGIILLIIIDQTIKIVINAYYLDCRFEIIPSLFEFKPTFNTKHSYVNVLLDKHFHINIGLLPHVVMFVLSGIVILTIYFSLKSISNNKNTKILDISIIFQMAAIFCALSGNLIWKKGTLDYIYLKPLFVFDLKDLYTDIFACLLFVYVFRNRGQLKNIEFKDLIRHAKIWKSK